MFFFKLLLRQCKNRPQELHFLVVIKQVRRPPELSVSWNPRNKRSRPWGAGSLLPNPSIRRPPRERGPPTTRADAPHPAGGRLWIMSASGGDALLTLRGQPVPQIPALPNFPLPAEAPGPSPGAATKRGERVRGARSLTGTRGRRGSPRPWRRR